MKKFFLIVFFTSLLFSQKDSSSFEMKEKKWEFSVSFSPELDFVTYKNRVKPIPAIAKLDSHKLSSFGFSAGFFANRKIVKGFWIGVGANYRNYQIDRKPFQSHLIGVDTVSQYYENSTYSFIDIPAQFSYRFKNNKFRFSLDLQIVPSLLFMQNYKYSFIGNSIIMPNSLEETTAYKPVYTAINIQPGLTLGYRFNPSLFLDFSPYFRFDTRMQLNLEAAQNWYAVGMNIRFGFGK